MSLRNRARNLQRKTGLSYQQALARLRELGERPAKLHRQSGWPLEVCDRFLVDGHAPIDVVALDGDAPIEVVAPIDVVEARPSGRQERITQICETLRATSGAREVVLDFARRGAVLRCGGEAGGPTLPVVKLLTRELLPGAGRSVWELDDDVIVVYTEPVTPHVLLVVRFHRDETSLGLVRLRVRKAIEELAPLVGRTDERSQPPPAGNQGGPAGGAPNELRVVAPVAAPRPRKKPTPIGRRKKG